MAQRIIFFLFILFSAKLSIAQENIQYNLDSLKREFLSLKTEVETIDLQLNQSKKKLKAGILVSTLGYTTTIIGGQLLGGPDNELGEVLLFVGGGIGIGGTYLIFDGFNNLGNKKKRRSKKP